MAEETPLLELAANPLAAPMTPLGGGVVWSGTAPPMSPEAASASLLEMTGLPSLERARLAAERGEILPALGEGAWGAAQLGSLAVPALRGVGRVANALVPSEAGAVKLGNALVPGLLGWHGTPHLFEEEVGAPLGKFRDEAIGSGEGAQAYGWGHYVAGKQGVGERYREGLAGSQLVPTDENGNALNFFDSAKKFYEPGSIVPGYGGTVDKVLKFNEGSGKYGGGWSVDVQQVTPTKDVPEEYYSKSRAELMQHPEYWRPMNGVYGQVRNHSTSPTGQEMEEVARSRGWQMTKPGALLEVHVLPEEHELLDWDKPLSEQHSSTQKILQNLMPNLPDNGDNWSGRMLYQNLGRMLKFASGENTAGVPGDGLASRALHEAGIPGIKYLDGGSRAAGEGTHNYVIFSPSNLRIIGRNGQRLEPVDHDPFAVVNPQKEK